MFCGHKQLHVVIIINSSCFTGAFAINILNIFRDMVPKFRTLLGKCAWSRIFVPPRDQLITVLYYEYTSKVRWGLLLLATVY